MSFTDQKPRTATEKDVSARWGGVANGARFRCYLCGHRFQIGEAWRFVSGSPKVSNLLVCSTCDGDDVLERWIQRCADFKRDNENKYWAFQ